MRILFFAAFILILFSACAQAKTAMPALPPTGTSIPNLSAAPTASLVATATLTPDHFDPFFLDTPYYDRQFSLVNTCNEGTCLFSDNLAQPSYPIGLVMVLGHYLQVERTRAGKIETCDGLVFDNAPAELLAAYQNYFKNDPAVYSQTQDGKTVINIALWNADEATKQILYSSSPENPATLHLLNEPPIDYGNVDCFSPVSLLGVSRTLASADVSHVYTITAADAGKVFTYVVTSRFSLLLDEAKYPYYDTACVPDTILGAIAGTGSYEIFKTGQCRLQNGSFHVTIVGVPDIWGSP
jgi:hypothetical protein